MIYLDNAATTRLSEAAFDFMKPYWSEEFGNPGAIYPFGTRAKQAVETARSRVAHFLGCQPEQLIFTSGGSESNSTVFHMMRRSLPESGRTHILVGATEHDSVLGAAEDLTRDGFTLELLPVSAEGTVSPRELERRITPETGLVSVMGVNNETGAVNLIEELGFICAEHDIFFHTDLVQAAATIPINLSELPCDFASVSAHKLHGPKGVGALYIKDPDSWYVRYPQLVFGGRDQEFGLRGGTENVPCLAAFGLACQELEQNWQEELNQISVVKQKFYYTLLDELGDDYEVRIHGPSPMVPGKILNFSVSGVDTESLILMLGEHGVCISAGSACNGRSPEPSHVLLAMGVSEIEARSSVRVSFSRYNTQAEVVEAAVLFAGCMRALRLLGERS